MSASGRTPYWKMGARETASSSGSYGKTLLIERLGESINSYRVHSRLHNETANGDLFADEPYLERNLCLRFTMFLPDIHRWKKN